MTRNKLIKTINSLTECVELMDCEIKELKTSKDIHKNNESALRGECNDLNNILLNIVKAVYEDSEVVQTISGNFDILEKNHDVPVGFSISKHSIKSDIRELKKNLNAARAIVSDDTERIRGLHETTGLASEESKRRMDLLRDIMDLWFGEVEGIEKADILTMMQQKFRWVMGEFDEKDKTIHDLKKESKGHQEMEEINLGCYIEEKAKTTKANAEKLMLLSIIQEWRKSTRYEDADRIFREYQSKLKQRRKKKGAKQ